MSNNLFSGDIWSVGELKDLLKKLEKMYAGGIRQSSFKDQTLIFGSTAEIKERITSIRDELTNRESQQSGGSSNPTRKKVVKLSTTGRGFC